MNFSIMNLEKTHHTIKTLVLDGMTVIIIMFIKQEDPKDMFPRTF